MNYKKLIYNDVTVYFLRKTITEAPNLDKKYSAIRQTNIKPEEYLKIYYDIGGRDWQWTERIILNSKQLKSKLEESYRHIYYFYIDSNLIGYFELDFSKEEVEIVYFGLLPTAIGKGLGKTMMNHAFNIIYQNNHNKVMLHTCSADSPMALPFYKKMGFEVYKTIDEKQAKLIF
jgi:GNAT superfamily N-acetyltransferase